MSGSSGSSDPNEQQQDRQKAEEQDFLKELNRLGQNLEQTARNVFESPHARSFQRDVAEGMQEFFTQLQNTARTAQQDTRMQKLFERGQQALNEAQEKVQDNKTLHELQASMARSIAFMNSQLQDFSRNLQQQQAEESTRAENVPIDEEQEAQTDTSAVPRGPGMPASEPQAAPPSPAPSASEAAHTEPPAAKPAPPSGSAATGPTVRLDPEEPGDQSSDKPDQTGT